MIDTDLAELDLIDQGFVAGWPIDLQPGDIFAYVLDLQFLGRPVTSQMFAVDRIERTKEGVSLIAYDEMDRPVHRNFAAYRPIFIAVPR